MARLSFSYFSAPTHSLAALHHIMQFDFISRSIVFLQESQQDIALVPNKIQLEAWVLKVLSHVKQLGLTELSLRVVDNQEMAELNQTYRKKSGTTNVLSFPYSAPSGVDIPLLGDVVLCLPVIIAESKQQQKQLPHHWAHLVVHGVLHLLGYDHISVEQASVMETMEIEILNELEISNPYLCTQF